MLKQSIGLSIASVLVFANVALAKVVDIKAIAGKTPTDVAKILGKPNRIEKARPSGTGCNPCDKAFYKNDKIEVLYIGGKADWITVNELEAVSHHQNSLTQFGLPIKAPTSSGNGLLEWTNLPGFAKVQLFGFSGKSDYLYIKVKTR